MDERVRKTVYSAMLAALTCCATLLRFPVGVGFVHAGDAVVLLGAFMLDPLWGALAAGLGSAMADLLAGYALYAPASFVIKALMALTAAAVLKRAAIKKPAVRAGVAGAAAELIMIAGYFAYDCFALRYGMAALGDLPANILQGLFGIIAGAFLYASVGRKKL